MLRVAIVRPGSTNFDEDGRIKGCLDVPLCERGASQVRRVADELSSFEIATVYASPCESARQSAEMIAERCGVRWKAVDCLRNVDQGLWQGKRIEEIRTLQPKIYRRYQETPDAVQPPGGESLTEARERVKKSLRNWLRKHDSETIALVVSEPLASLIRQMLSSSELGDLWETFSDRGTWELIEVEPASHALT